MTKPRNDEPLVTELRGLLVRITIEAQDMIELRGERSDRVDVQQQAKELRDPPTGSARSSTR